MTPEVAAAASRHVVKREGYLHDNLDPSWCSCSGERARPAPASLPDGGVCHVCGGIMVRTGTCSTCTSCGETGGCG